VTRKPYTRRPRILSQVSPGFSKYGRFYRAGGIRASLCGGCHTANLILNNASDSDNPLKLFFLEAILSRTRRPRGTAQAISRSVARPAQRLGVSTVAKTEPDLGFGAAFLIRGSWRPIATPAEQCAGSCVRRSVQWMAGRRRQGAFGAGWKEWWQWVLGNLVSFLHRNSARRT